MPRPIGVMRGPATEPELVNAGLVSIEPTLPHDTGWEFDPDAAPKRRESNAPKQPVHKQNLLVLSAAALLAFIAAACAWYVLNH